MTLQPLTTIHVAAPAAYGGLETVVCELARGHAALGHRVHVISVVGTGDDRSALAAGIPGVTVHVVAVPSRSYMRERAAVARIAQEVGAQVVHTHGYRPDVVDAGGARALGLPTVSTVHGFTGGDLKNRLFEWLQVRSLRCLDAVVAVSRPMADRLLRAGVSPERLHLIRNAWVANEPFLSRADARARLGVPESAPLVGFVGRLSAEKGADVLLDAVALLGPAAPMVAFIGDGPQAGALAVRSTAAGLESHVRWCGRIARAAPLLRAFDVVALSSRTEGTPMVLLEAMAAGVPVVASRVGGVPDVVSEKEAVLVAPEDPEALAQALRGALAEAGASAARAEAARDRVDREFAITPWLARYEALYRAVAGAR